MAQLIVVLNEREPPMSVDNLNVKGIYHVVLSLPKLELTEYEISAYANTMVRILLQCMQDSK
jgi:hypothetical protein